MQKMVGITLSPEQIQQAPAEVRRWLEQQITGTLGLYRAEPAFQTPSRHLVGCTLEEARTMLSLIQGFLPVVSVFFELGREPFAASAQGVRALRLDDMLRHTHLQAPEQIAACLEAIDEALQRVRAEPGAALTAFDGAGHCLVAQATAQSVQALWQEIVSAHDLARAETASSPGAARSAPETFQSPYSISVPPFATRQADSRAAG
jgi:hypothetical protein